MCFQAHYEPIKEAKVVQETPNVSLGMQHIETSEMEEFSEPEDLMAGIRSVGGCRF